MEAMGGIKEAIKNLNGRASAMHKRVGGIQVEVGDARSDIRVLQTEVDDLRGDIERVDSTIQREGESLRKLIREESATNRASNNKVIMALIGFALTAAGSAITIAFTLGGSP